VHGLTKAGLAVGAAGGVLGVSTLLGLGAERLDNALSETKADAIADCLAGEPLQGEMDEDLVKCLEDKMVYGMVSIVPTNEFQPGQSIERIRGHMGHLNHDAETFDPLVELTASIGIPILAAGYVTYLALQRY